MSVLCQHCKNQVTIKTDKCPYCEKPLTAASPVRVIRYIPLLLFLGFIAGPIYLFWEPINETVRGIIDSRSEFETTPPPPRKKQLGPADSYIKLMETLDQNDLLSARKYLAKTKLDEMEDQSTQAIVDALTPDVPMPDPKIVFEQTNGNKAVLVLDSKPEGFTNASGQPISATGIIRMVRENGSWKIFDQMWHIAPPKDPVPAALEWLNGTQAKIDNVAAFEYDLDKCFEAIVESNSKYVKFCLSSGMTPHTPWDDDVNAFDFALLHITGNEAEDVDVVLAFLDAGADINQSRRGGMTPLMLAALSCRVDIVEAFIQRGADPKLKGTNGLDPMWAAQDCPEVRRILETAN